MFYVGRVKRLVALGVLLSYCLAGVGCYVSLNYSLDKPKPNTPATAGEPTPPGTLMPSDLPPGQPAGQPPQGLLQTAFTDKPMPGDVRPPDGQPKPPDAAAGPVVAPGLPHGPTTGMVPPLPRELAKVSFPPYVIEPPDILLLSAVRLIPRPPYQIQPLDVLTLQVTNTFPNQPISGLFPVQPDGTIVLGYSYGIVRVGGLTLEAAQKLVREELAKRLNAPQVFLGLASFRGLQSISGQHLVRPDGTISLGSYGCVYVAGLTLSQARQVIEGYLGQFLLDPDIAVDVLAYNSKFIYVIADGAGFGQRAIRVPATGNETVLDVISLIGGIPAPGSRRRIWVARPAPANHACLQVLPVDWLAIAEGGSTRTNYQLFPGDRVYIKADPLIHFNNALSKILAPVNQILGTTLLGASLAQLFRNNGNSGVFFGTVR
jgi:polysaccharide export outer membrane protein